MNEEMTLKLSPKELDYVWQALSQRPFGEVAPLMSKIQGQVAAQQPPKEAANG